MERVISFVGLFFMMAIAWGLSNNKKKIPWRVIGGGIALQFFLALIILKTGPGEAFFEAARVAINKIISLSDKGAMFIFGEDYHVHFFAFKVLPTIIFVSSIASVLFYWGILQRVINAMALVMQKIMGISGSESLAAAANVFCGQTEAPLLVKPYIATMTRSEINCMMCGGMATVAGGVLAAYVGFGISAGHLLAASLMSAPAAILVAKIMFPETEKSPTYGAVKLELQKEDVNTFGAACRGASDGLILALNVGAMLIAFIALVELVNVILGAATGWMMTEPLTLQTIFSYIFYPIAFMMGIPTEDCFKIAQLLGEKMVINEFVAFADLGKQITAGNLQPRSITIATYALCGFANFSSIAIQIGGIGSLEPKRKKDFAKVGLISMIGGTLAAFMTACVAGILI